MKYIFSCFWLVTYSSLYRLFAILHVVLEFQYAVQKCCYYFLIKIKNGSLIDPINSQFSFKNRKINVYTHGKS